MTAPQPVTPEVLEDLAADVTEELIDKLLDGLTPEDARRALIRVVREAKQSLRFWNEEMEMRS